MLKVEYRDHIGFENKRLENEIHSRMTAYRAAMGGEESDDDAKLDYSVSYMSMPEEDSLSAGYRGGIFHSKIHSDRDPEVDGKRGYIRRVSVERDARLKKLELTEVGVRMQRRNDPQYQSAGKHCFVREYQMKSWKYFSV
ncbi:MAG: hypothetical protein ACLVAT_03140 [Lachnospiraceae bacterium]